MVSNGADASATLLDACDDSCHARVDFHARFDAADMDIAKGQDNYKSLIEPVSDVRDALAAWRDQEMKNSW